MLGVGAWLKNRACLIDGGMAYWSPEHGNLSESTACLALDRSADSLIHLLAPDAPDALAHDLHPDFYSTRFAVGLAARLGVPAIPVQHHHAHIAAMVAARGITRPVIGIALDGVGHGTDGGAWGGELLWVDGWQRTHRWRRLAHLSPLYLPGGDQAVREPWRLGAALLFELGRHTDIDRFFSPVVGRQAVQVIICMLERRLNCPASTSAGRCFDAAAAALGLSNHQRREGEAAEILEIHAQRFLHAHPDFEVTWQSLDLQPLIASLFEIDRADAERVERGAASFHLALVDALAQAAMTAAAGESVQDVVLGGGCFINRILRERLADRLSRAGLCVHVPQSALCGDTGLALGQAWVAACTLREARGVSTPSTRLPVTSSAGNDPNCSPLIAGCTPFDTPELC